MTSLNSAQTNGTASGHMPLSDGNGAAADACVPWTGTGNASPAAPPAPRPGIAVADWDVMFDAVCARLIHAVGERLGDRPDVPQHSAEFSASLVQAVVLDCVSALEQLHATLQQERSQRPTP